MMPDTIEMLSALGKNIGDYNWDGNGTCWNPYSHSANLLWSEPAHAFTILLITTLALAHRECEVAAIAISFLLISPVLIYLELHGRLE